MSQNTTAMTRGGVQAPSAAPGPVSDTQQSQFLSDVLTAAGLITHGKRCKALGERLSDMVMRLRAASPTPPAEQQATKETSGGFHVWRDISTAPKDGSRFVATGHNYGLYSEGRHACVAQWFRGSWIEASEWNEASELTYLTHWMPLPSPPDDVAAPAEQQAAPKAAPAAVGHDEDLLEKLYWDFDSQRKKTGEERLAFKGKMRSYASEFRRRSVGKMTFAQSVSDDMMNLADRLGSEYDDVDPIAWKHLLVYAPKESPAAVAGPSDSEIDALVASIGPTEGMSRDSRDLIMDKLRVLVRRALATWGHVNAAPGEQNESAYQRGYMDGMAKGRRDAEAAPQQEAQEPCPTCAALARTVMCDQVSFDRKPDCYGIRRITDDEGVEEWEDIRTSPDVAREEANDMMATGRGEIYEVVPLWTTPQPTQAQAGAVPLTKEQRSRIVLTADTVSEAIDMVERHHGIKGGQHGAE